MKTQQHGFISAMNQKILLNLENPGELEKLYRENKNVFKRAFNVAYPDIQDKLTARIWHERLNYEENVSWGSRGEVVFIIIAACMGILLAEIPFFTGVSQEWFYSRNLGFLVFPALTAYFAWKQNISPARWIMIAVAYIISAIYINTLPDNNASDTLTLACIHLPVFLWALAGFSFTGNKSKPHSNRLDFLRLNGDVVVMNTVILIAGAILTAVSLNLFILIDIHIEEFYTQHLVVWGLIAAPIISTFLVRTNPQLVNKISPLIARIFTPLVLITLVVYLFAVIFTGKDPYNNTDFLLLFNLLLIGVMALIIFSIAEISKSSTKLTGTVILFVLSMVTIIVNCIALSAIVFRITEWGITPNRLAVLGSNVLILTNLLMVTFCLYKTTANGQPIENVEKTISQFLPVYVMWTIVVVFLFPVIFNFI